MSEPDILSEYFRNSDRFWYGHTVVAMPAYRGRPGRKKTKGQKQNRTSAGVGKLARQIAGVLLQELIVLKFYKTLVLLLDGGQER